MFCCVVSFDEATRNVLITVFLCADFPPRELLGHYHAELLGCMQHTFCFICWGTAAVAAEQQGKSIVVFVALFGS